MKAKIILLFFFFSIFLLNSSVRAQVPGCDSLVPVFNIDFTAATSDSTWLSPSVSRNGNCCGTLPPDRCVLFVITVGNNTVALTFNMYCSLPSGSIFYQVDCGTPMPYGDTTFISVPGVYYLTYCKPGNIPCTYSITSISPQIPTGTGENEGSRSSLAHDAAGNYFLNLDLHSPSTFNISVVSAEGRKISEKKYSLASGHQQVPVSTQSLSRGIYFVKINVGRQSAVHKLVIAE